MNQLTQKTFLFLLVMLTLTGCAQQTSKQDCSNYDEAVIPVTVTTNWAEVPKGLQSAMGSIDERYMQHEVPEMSKNTNWSGSAWKGERTSAQIVLWSKDSVASVEFKVADFRGENNATIAANNIQTRFVRYVITDEYAEGCGNRKPEDYAQSLSPDVLDNIDCMNIKAETVRPVWITIDVPSDAAAGKYDAKVDLLVNGKKKETFTLSSTCWIKPCHTILNGISI